MQTITIEILLGALAFVATTVLGAAIFFRRPRSWTHRLFFILAFLIDVYIVVNFLSLHPPDTTAASQLFWIRIVMFVTSFIGPVLVLLVHTFPGDTIRLRRVYHYLLVGLMSASALASIFPFVFRGIHYPDGEPIPIPGVGMPIFLLDFIGLFILSFAILIYRYRHTTGEERARHVHLLLGVLASFSLMGLTTVLFVVVLQTSSFVFLGPLVPVILLAFIAHAIVKHGLFDMKVIATQAFVVILWIFLFAKIFVAESFSALFVDVLVFLAVFLFGFLVVGSVRREVVQRKELEKLASRLHATNMRLKELDRLKSEFLSFASHQVKSPMTVVKGYASLIYDGTYGVVSDKVRDTARKIVRSADTMIALVNNLLDSRRIEEGRMEYSFETVPVGALVKGVVDGLRALAEEKHLILTFRTSAGGAAASLDRQKFEQVVQNLVDNAIKYTEQGRVEVGVRLGNAKEHVIVSIRDTGLGLSSDLLTRLFDQFIRGKGVMKRIRGTGLGLYIAKQVVLAHKGTIVADSPGEGKGSTFTVTVPVVKS